MEGPKQTPWGESDGEERIADGITFYTTASHGGIHLSSYRQKAVEARFPNFTPFVGKGPWFEEDCDVCIVMLTFPYEFTPDQVKRAIRQAMKLGDYSFTKENWLSVVRWLNSDAADGVRARAYGKLIPVTS